MPNNLNVSLDKTTTPWTVDVDQQGNANHVGRSSNAQTITWQLTGNAASGSIVSFAWVGTAPPSTIFGPPDISTNSKQLTITDLNNSASSAGDWTYALSIEVGGTVYSTISTLPTATTTNPTIKNV